MMRVVALVFSLVATVPMACGVSPGFPAYERANKLFVAKRFPESMSAIEEALRLEPRLVPALTLKAKLAMAVNRFDIARDSLERALRSDPRSHYAQFLYGLQFYMSADLQSALPQFEKARLLNPTDGRTVLYIGLTQESLGRNAAALSAYREALGLEDAAGAPQVETLLAGARLMLLLGRADEGRQWIDRALKLEPGSRAAHFEAARLMLANGAARRAAVEGETALSLPGADVADSQIHYLLIRAWRESGQTAKAAGHADAVRLLETPPGTGK